MAPQPWDRFVVLSAWLFPGPSSGHSTRSGCAPGGRELGSSRRIFWQPQQEGAREQPGRRHILSTQKHPPDPSLSPSEELVHIKIIPSKGPGETSTEVLMSQAGTGIDLDGFVNFIKNFREDAQHTNTSPSLGSEGSPSQDEPKVPSSDPRLVLPHLVLSEPWKQRIKQEIRAEFDAADKQLKSEGKKAKPQMRFQLCLLWAFSCNAMEIPHIPIFTSLLLLKPGQPLLQ